MEPSRHNGCRCWPALTPSHRRSAPSGSSASICGCAKPALPTICSPIPRGTYSPGGSIWCRSSFRRMPGPRSRPQSSSAPGCLKPCSETSTALKPLWRADLCRRNSSTAIRRIYARASISRRHRAVSSFLPSIWRAVTMVAGALSTRTSRRLPASAMRWPTEPFCPTCLATFSRPARPYGSRPSSSSCRKAWRGGSIAQTPALPC